MTVNRFVVALTAASVTLTLPLGSAQAANVQDLPQHYSTPGAHLRGGQTTLVSRFWGWGPSGSSDVVYVVGDSMAGQIAHPVHLAFPSVRVKPRTKASTPFRLPATDDSEWARYSRAVLDQMVADEREGKDVVAVLSMQKGTAAQRRTTIRKLTAYGIEVRQVTSTPLPTDGTRPGQDWTMKSTGSGRWWTVTAGRATGTTTVDLRGIVARPATGGRYKGVVNGSPVYREGSHVTVAFADRTLTWHLARKLGL